MPLEDAFARLQASVEALTRQVETTNRAAESGRGGVASSEDGGGKRSLLERARGGVDDFVSDLGAGRLLGGGVTGGIAAIAATGAVAAAQTLAPAVEAGLKATLDGGSFAVGGLTELNRIAAGVPFLGELGGFKGTADVLGGAQRDLNSITNESARFGGQVSDQFRDFLAGQLVDQQRRIGADRDANQIAVEGRFVQAAEGQGAGLAAALGRAILGLNSNVQASATNAGVNQHS